MKTLLTSFFILAFAHLSFCQAPQSFSYQAIARDALGNGIPNQTVELRISILEGSITGSSVYTETHTVTTDANGVLNLAIGTGTTTAGTFASINWGNNTFFVKIEMDITGGTNYVLMGTSQLLSVPYALYAGNVTLTKGNTQMEVYISDEGALYGLKKINVNTAASVTDIDGNTYGTVQIGTQTWMTENLRTTKLNDGTVIPNITNGTDWSNLTTPAYSTYNNTLNVDTINAFGRLYNFYTVNTNNLCPSGWHVPSKSEIETLITYLGPLASNRLRSPNYWSTEGNENANAINDTKLSAYASGERWDQYQGQFVGLGIIVSWWSSTITSSPQNAYELTIRGNSTFTGYYGTYIIDRAINSGRSVR